MSDYNKLTDELIDQIRTAANGHVLTGEDVSDDFSRDEMPIYGTSAPEAVVQPLTTEEVSAVMKICNDNRIAVTPRGAGTGLVGGAVPLYGGIVLDTTKMNKIIG